jgi:hypothetical protein
LKFGKWDESVHEDYEQIKRIATMQKIKAEKVSVYPETQTAKIEGRDGIYDVTLDSCTCFDFATRGLPCKHIYRLAYELGLLELPKTNRKAAKEFKENIPNEIEKCKELYLNGAISVDKFSKLVNALISK